MGSLRFKSCLANLLSFCRKVYEAADKDDSHEVVDLDFSKAFDCVPHRRLPRKLMARGIGGKAYNWITAWISDRKHRVAVNSKNI